MKHLMFSLAALLFAAVASAQVTTLPPLALPDDSATIIYDAAQGNRALFNFSGTLYAHAGVVTNRSTSPTDWRHVIGNWGTDDARVRMRSLGNNRYELKYPNLRNFYGVPATDTIYRLAFVFRNLDGSIVGRASGGGDIFVDVARPGLSAAFLQPSNPQTIVNLGSMYSISAGSSNADTLKLFINGVNVSTVAGNSLMYAYTASVAGRVELEARAITRAGASTSARSAIFVRTLSPPVAPLPAGVRDGINYLNDSTVTLVLFAPMKSYVFAIGSFNNWILESSTYMNRTPDGQRYWTTLRGLTPGREYIYQYLVDGQLRIADPLTEKVLDPDHDRFISAATYPNLLPYPLGKTSRIASVFQTAQPPYVWEVPNFSLPKVEDMVVYELHVRDFTTTDRFQQVIDSLDYLKRLGINVLELMPVAEFEGNDSWGYNPSFFLALDKYYGTPNTFRRLVDECHKRGMAVVLDIVLNHSFGQNPMVELYWDAANNRPAANNPWFNPIARHDFNVGYDFNHESQATKNFSYRVVKHWIQAYNIDGYRFDLSKGLTQTNTLGDAGAMARYDASRINILRAIGDTIRSIKPDAYIILEHFAENSEERALSDLGFMLWGNHNFNYNEATMGFHDNGKSDFSWISYKNRGWNDPHVIGYMESHDEERLMYKNLQFGNSGPNNYNIKDLATALKRIEAAAAFFFTIPGPKMIWQFGELGYEVDINFNGRTGRKPVRWSYYQESNRRALYNVFSDLAHLKVNEPAFESDDFNLDVRNALKRILILHADMDVIVLGNFGVTAGNINPMFTRTGKWYDFFSGDSITVNSPTANLSLQAGEYRLYTTKRLRRYSAITRVESPAAPLQLSVFPNPGQDDFQLQFSLERPVAVSWRLYDLSGKEIAGQPAQFLPAGPHSLEIRMPARAADGLYLLQVSAGASLSTHRLQLSRR